MNIYRINTIQYLISLLFLIDNTSDYSPPLHHSFMSVLRFRILFYFIIFTNWYIKILIVTGSLFRKLFPAMSYIGNTHPRIFSAQLKIVLDSTLRYVMSLWLQIHRPALRPFIYLNFSFAYPSFNNWFFL